ncbi:MAG TPA: histidinol-phosphatase HisJ family protein [Clostridia bacterium]|nr:histidinol-phosphatase HisJ family protein [Clostridia bacterium]
MYDCHMHTKFSTDSVMDADAACDAAVKLGIDGVAFTDHLDFDYPGETFNIDFDEYFSHILSVRQRHEENLKVLTAVEVGIQPHVMAESLEVVMRYPFDYVLASVHIIDRLDPYTGTYYEGRSKAEAYERYLQEILYMVRNFESFDMVGHFEYIIRYAHYPDRTLRYAEHSETLDAIMKELIADGRGFELNTGTYRNSPKDAEYDMEVLKRYRSLGGELICLGSDAHRTGHIAMRFDYYSRMLRESGFKYTVHFEERKPVFDKL